MEIILLEKVDNLGNIGDRVKVRSGYGRNFLLPKGKATLATPEKIALFEERRAELERNGRIPAVPVYVDSPMALAALATYRTAIREGWDEIRPELHGM